jgi:hypothetical protein
MANRISQYFRLSKKIGPAAVVVNLHKIFAAEKTQVSMIGIFKKGLAVWDSL